jgi:hypothetical protein
MQTTASEEKPKSSRRTRSATDTNAQKDIKSSSTASAKSTTKLSLKDRLAKRIQSKRAGEPTTPPVADEVIAAAPTQEAKKPRRAAKPAEPREAAPVEQVEDAGYDYDDTIGSKVFINLGRKDGYNAQRLKDLIADLGGLLPEDIFSASIRPRFSFLMVDEDYVDDLLEAITGERVKGRQLRIERARDDQ